MAAGDLTVVGTATVGVKVSTPKVEGITNTDVVTNLNADQVDGADKDTDGTLAANSDAKVPSQKAVKTYADAIDAKDAQNVKLTGNQTIAGIKTFSSIPVLPTNTIETAHIQDSAVIASKIGSLAVTNAKINKAHTSGTQVIGVSGDWVVPEGIYTMVVAAGSAQLAVFYTSAWWLSLLNFSGGVVISDGSWVKFYAGASGATIYYRKLS